MPENGQEIIASDHGSDVSPLKPFYYAIGLVFTAGIRNGHHMLKPKIMIKATKRISIRKTPNLDKDTLLRFALRGFMLDDCAAAAFW